MSLLTILSACAVEDAGEEGDDGTTAYQLATDPLVIPPGGQGFICQTFANPAAREVDVLAWTALQAEAGHHVQVFVVDDGAPVAAGPCDGLPFGGLTFQSQGRGAETSLRYPDGVAARLPAGSGLYVEVHYLNTSDQDVTMSKTIELEVADPDDDRALVGPILMENLDIDVPPGGAVVERTCHVDEDIDVAWLSAHLHYHGMSFEATVDGGDLYWTDDAIEPPIESFDPLRRIEAGSEVSFACTYFNDTASTLHFGQDLETSEMCILSGAYVRADRGAAPLLRCTDSGGDGCLACAQAVAGGDPSQACTDDGQPSSADKVAALQACTCGADACGDACAASACTGGAPDDECQACSEAMCADELMACFGG